MAMQLKMIGALLALAIGSLAHAAGGAKIEPNPDTDIEVYLPDLRMSYFPEHPKFILFHDKKNGDQRIPVLCVQSDVAKLRGRLSQAEFAAKVAELLSDDSKGFLKDDLAVCFNHSDATGETPNPPYKPFPGTKKWKNSDRPNVEIVNTAHLKSEIFSFQNTNPNLVSLPSYYATLMNHYIFVAIFGKTMLEVAKEKRAGQ